jgi:hypothetical protein
VFESNIPVKYCPIFMRIVEVAAGERGCERGVNALFKKCNFVVQVSTKSPQLRRSVRHLRIVVSALRGVK